ncbi:MAG: hypothetical protein U9N77_13400 [Thermodesulfobacteriota bacterium]|nr:hypothetical protein [Thermodesulfobacteriota bacterium]
MKKMLLFAAVLAFVLIPMTSFATMGNMSLASKDINMKFFGSLKTYPTWTSDLDFGGDQDADWMLDENGMMTDFTTRNELRLGWKGGNDKFDFMIILEGDFVLDKNNTDRGAVNTANGYATNDLGMSGEDFGIEKMDVGYDFGPFRIHTGWTTRWLDIQTGGLVYGDDHPYIGFTGSIGPNFKWEIDYTSIFDTIEGTTFDGDNLDWRVYSVKGTYKLPCGFNVGGFYAFSDNTAQNNAQVSYLGLQGFGTIGMFTPRFEIAYADGDTDENAAGQDYDISAMAAFASLDIKVNSAFIPYLGFKFEEGDDDPNDSDIDAFNSITDISRYTPTFGMENAFVYRLLTSLGTHLYSGNFNMNGTQAGYGGISNSSKGDAPGLVMWGIGVKGKFMENWSYKAQYMNFEFDAAPDGIDDEVGQEFDLRVQYTFSKHFSIANCFAAFDPGDAVQDLKGDDFDDTGFMNTVELTWKW